MDRRKDLTLKNNNGQMHVLEAVIVAGMIFSSLFFVSNMEVSSYTTIEKENKLKSLGASILENLEARQDSTGKYDNLLLYCIRDVSGSNRLYYELTANLPEGTLFRVSIVNMSKLFHNSSASHEDCVYARIGTDIWVEEETRVSRIIAFDGEIYEIILQLWLNTGGD